MTLRGSLSIISEWHTFSGCILFLGLAFQRLSFIMLLWGRFLTHCDFVHDFTHITVRDLHADKTLAKSVIIVSQ